MTTTMTVIMAHVASAERKEYLKSNRSKLDIRIILYSYVLMCIVTNNTHNGSNHPGLKHQCIDSWLNDK